ncbi:methyltransferase domain-containing protein [Cognataquiflexum rubidum]
MQTAKRFGYANYIPDNSFDTFILTKMLHIIYEYQEVLKTYSRILKPRG